MAASSSSGAYEPTAVSLRVTTYNVGITGDLANVGAPPLTRTCETDPIETCRVASHGVFHQTQPCDVMCSVQAEQCPFRSHLCLRTGAKIAFNLQELAEDADIVFLQELGPWDKSIPEDPARQRVWCRLAGTSTVSGASHRLPPCAHGVDRTIQRSRLTRQLRS